MDAGQRPVADVRALALCYTAGVLAVHALRELPSLPMLAAAALPLLIAFRWRLHYMLFLLGVLLTTWLAREQVAQRWPAARHNQQIAVAGHIVSLPELKISTDRNGEPAQTWRFQFQPLDPSLPLTRASWYRSEHALRGGECWRFTLRMKTPHGSLNPGAFDYEAWLFRQGIGATATVKTGERCDHPGQHGLLELRQRIVERLRAWLPDHPGGALVAALTVGDDSGLTDADWEVFRLTGTTHLVVISGFNLGIIAGFAFFICRWVWSLWPPLCLKMPAQKVGALGSALAATAYALLAGFEPPVVRALLMLLFLLAALILHRLSQPSRVLALAWLVILLLDPFAILSPGLWLSFGAVAMILYSAPRWRGVTVIPTLIPGTQTPQPDQTPTDKKNLRLNRLWVRFGFWLRSYFIVQLALSVAVPPLTLYFFHGVSLTSPLVNLLAVPWFALLTPLVLIGVFLQTAGLPLLPRVADLLAQTQGALTAIGKLPDLWLAASPPPAALALALFGAVLLFAPRRLPLWLPGVLCFTPLFWPPSQAPSDGVELSALDVGQGLAVVLRTRNHALLFDAGPAFEDGFDAGRSIVAPYLLSRGIGQLDLMLLSHDHNDHTGGAPALRRLLRVRDERGAATSRPCREGERWEWDGVRFELLHPDPDARWGENNVSCVLRVSVGEHALLLPGDIERAAEARLLRERPDTLRADLLLAPHHGSKTSSTQAWVAAVQAKLVIHSAGWRHHFRHPHPDVVHRYAQAGAEQRVTAQQGALRLTLTAAGLSPVRAHRVEAARWWNAVPETLVIENPADRLSENTR